MQKPHVVIIGHSGFIGSQIFKQLKDKVNLNGYSTSQFNLLNKKSILGLKNKINNSTVMIITASVNREKGDTLINMLRHIRMIVNIAQLLQSKPIYKCVYLSSIDVYGRPDKFPITEQTPANPITYYAIAKFTCEKVLERICQKKNIELLILRYNGIFGPGQKITGYGANNFIKSAIQENLIRLWGDGKEKRDTVYVVDLAKIIIKLSLKNPSGIINIATGNQISFSQMSEIVQKISRQKLNIISRERTSPAWDHKFDTTKLKSQLGKFNFTPFPKAVKTTYSYYLSIHKKGEKLTYD